MSQVPNRPPKLTQALITKIDEQIAEIAHDSKGGPASPLDWIAAHAGVTKVTIKKWLRMGKAVEHSQASGPRADVWLAFVSAVGGLTSSCANRVAGAIGKIALNGETPKQQLDALGMLQKRLDRHEIDLDATDVVVTADDAVAHMPQEMLDALTDEQMAELAQAETAMIAANATRDRILATARDAVPD